MREREIDYEHMSDPLDIAARNADKIHEMALAEQRLAAKPKQVKLPDGTWPNPYCVECGDEIEPKRLEATGTDICVECARERELLEKQRRK